MSQSKLQAIYTSMIGEAVTRLRAAEDFLSEYSAHADLPRLEAAILQLRKSLEAIAFAAIAPDKHQYQALRATADKDPDFTKDYHAARIFSALSRINPDFYPKPLAPAVQQPDGSWHFGDSPAKFLSQKQFERVYDRLGKHLHAHNPWSSGKVIQNLAADLPSIIRNTRGLLELHARFIRSPEFRGVWVVDARSPKPTVISAIAHGPYTLHIPAKSSL